MSKHSEPVIAIFPIARWWLPINLVRPPVPLTYGASEIASGTQRSSRPQECDKDSRPAYYCISQRLSTTHLSLHPKIAQLLRIKQSWSIKNCSLNETWKEIPQSFFNKSEDCLWQKNAGIDIFVKYKISECKRLFEWFSVWRRTSRWLNPRAILGQGRRLGNYSQGLYETPESSVP